MLFQLDNMRARIKDYHRLDKVNYICPSANLKSKVIYLHINDDITEQKVDLNES